MAEPQCICKAGKGKGTPGGMIKISDHVIIAVPFPRQVFPVNVPDSEGVIRRKGVIRYLYQGNWIDGDALLARWQPWRDVVVGPSRPAARSGPGRVEAAESRQGPAAA